MLQKQGQQRWRLAALSCAVSDGIHIEICLVSFEDDEGTGTYSDQLTLDIAKYFSNFQFSNFFWAEVSVPQAEPRRQHTVFSWKAS